MRGDHYWFAAAAADGRVQLARGRPVVFRRRNFDVEVASNQVATALGLKIWVFDDTLATQSARRRQLLQVGVRDTREKCLRRRTGVNGTAGASAGGSEPAELGAGRPSSRRDGARRAPDAHASRRRLAAGSPRAKRTRAPHICGLEGRRYIIRMGPGSRLGSCTASTLARHLHVPIGSHS